MTTKENASSANLETLNENLARVEELSKRLVDVMTHRKPLRAELNAPDTEVFVNAANAYVQSMVQNPGKMFEHQLEYWTKSVRHFVDAKTC